jgi:hypothetical protein|tara:strand:+ start:421 stop:1767 length:1347 start_codon:yes stop_codon:yes gene_type:complete
MVTSKSPKLIYDLRKRFDQVARTVYLDPEGYQIIDNQQQKQIVPIITLPVDMTFYVLMSRYFKDSLIKFAGEAHDLRLNFFYIGASRTGKGQLIKALETTGKQLNLKIKRLSYLNQASLIGTIDGEAIKYNKLKRLKLSDPKYINPITYGDLHDTDILIIPEAKKLVKSTNEAETEFILSTLQEALDYPGIIDKKLKYEERIHYECRAVMFATTYFIQEISRLLLEQGYFQRVILYKKDLNLKKTEELRTMIINNYRASFTKKNLKAEAAKFANIIRQINNAPKELHMTNDAVDLLQKFNKTYFSKIKIYRGKQLEILKSFSQTLLQTCVKIGGINACLREDTNIMSHDLSTGIDILNAFTDTITRQISIEEKKTGEDTHKERIVHIYKEYIGHNVGLPNKEKLVDACAKKGIGRNKTLSLLNKMIEENYFTEQSGLKNEKILTLIQS